MNASTFTARVVASTGADCAAALSSAVGALSGPLHGGAPARVLEMLDEVTSSATPTLGVVGAGPRRAPVGFGHRAHRAWIRAPAVLRRTAPRPGGSTCFEVAEGRLSEPRSPSCRASTRSGLRACSSASAARSSASATSKRVEAQVAGRAPQHAGARILGPIDAVPEAHEALAAVQPRRGPSARGRRARSPPHRASAARAGRAAVQRAAQRADRAGEGGGHVGAGRGDDARGEGRGVHAVLGGRDPVGVDRLGVVGVGLAAPADQEALGDRAAPSRPRSGGPAGGPTPRADCATSSAPSPRRARGRRAPARR